MRKLVFITCALFAFAIGAYTWKIQYGGQKTAAASRASFAEKKDKSDFLLRPVLAVVNGEAVSAKELEWEYNLHVQGSLQGIFDTRKLTPIPNLGKTYHQELLPLKQRLASGIIERKVLYNYIKQDSSFDASDSQRYAGCLEQWQNTIDPKNPLLSGPENEARLKTRLCEQNLIYQYLNEKILSKLEVSNQEIEEYFKQHKKQFETPERVIIRQILLSDEKIAKQIRSQAHNGNFAELAKEHSIAPEAAQGGLLGPIPITSLPHIFDVIYSMKPGSISDVLKSTYGFHIILLVERLPKSDPKLSEATPIIKNAIKQTKEEEEYQKWLHGALDTIPVTAPSTL